MAIADAVAKTLEGRNGVRLGTAPAREKFPEVEGRPRDIAASKSGLGSGLQIGYMEPQGEKNPAKSSRVFFA